MSNLTQSKIALKYRKAFVIPAWRDSKCQNLPTPQAITFAMEALMLGFRVTKELLFAISDSEEDLGVFLEDLRELKGAHVKHKPMYPNFPEQVAEASDIELYLNAFVHYWSYGAWSPEYEVLPREYADEDSKIIELGVIGNDAFGDIYLQLIGANESLSEGDKETIVWFIDNTDVPAILEVPFKENLCFYAGELLKRGNDISYCIDNVTDVLRIATALNDGDVSLSTDTKFKSLPRKTRRLLTKAIEDVILNGSGSHNEDINRHRGKWTALFHNLHVGEYSDLVYKVAKKVRNNEKIVTFNSQVQAALDANDYPKVLELLTTRPGEFARRLDLVLRKFEEKDSITCRMFKGAVGSMNTRTLLQVYGHFKTRFKDTEMRVAFPKGSIQKALLLEGQKGLNAATVLKIQASIKTELASRWSEGDDLGNVYVDEGLRDCPIPTQQRSASEGLFQVARATRLPIAGDKNTLRFFVYWVGHDIDLSATLHDENFKNVGHVSYTHLRSDKYQSYHSGDIISAPKGASEFIDITIDGALEAGARYVAMNVLSFSQIPFNEIETCFVGWMTRAKPNSNEIFDPKTVEQKIDLRGNTKNTVPVLFDLKNRQAIWADMSTSSQWSFQRHWRVCN